MNEELEFSVALSKWFGDRGDETLRLDYPLTSDSIVLDLGGYKGDFAYEINKRYGCYVYVFEPVKSFYNYCVDRFKNNTKIKNFNCGLSDSTGTAFISNEDTGSSILKNNTEDCEKINLVQFKEQTDILGIEKIDLLKINVEGAEFLILPHLFETDLIKKINHIQIQFHNFYTDAEKLRRGIREKLAETHIQKWNYTFVWESWSLK